MATHEDLHLICEMAAHHCMTITEAPKQSRPTVELEAEPSGPNEARVTQLYGTGYFAQYLRVFPEYESSTAM